MISLGIESISTLQTEALSSLEPVQTAAELEAWRIEFLSRQGKLTTLLEGLKNVPPSERPQIGRAANEAKKAILDAFEARKTQLEEKESSPTVEDPTMPGRRFPHGNAHVLTQTCDRILKIFRHLGFAIADGPEIETTYHCFDALNSPPDHPGRDERDTFYIDAPADPKFGRLLLRTQTSTVQIRYMEKNPHPPIQIVAPGRCYRRDEIDATHGVFFHQIEGLVVNSTTSLADMVGTMQYFFKELLGPDTEVRFRTHFFPFTEPSFEVDFSQPGLTIRGKKWLEIAGCGMVDPAVLTQVGIDPEKYNGWAFGMGIERIAMILHDIPDLRFFYQNDIRFLNQFS